MLLRIITKVVRSASLLAPLPSRNVLLAKPYVSSFPAVKTTTHYRGLSTLRENGAASQQEGEEGEGEEGEGEEGVKMPRVVPIRLYTPNGIAATNLFNSALTSAVKGDPNFLFTVASELSDFVELSNTDEMQEGVLDPSKRVEYVQEFVELYSEKVNLSPVTLELLEELAETKKLSNVEDILKDYERLLKAFFSIYDVQVEVPKAESIPSDKALINLFELPEDATLNVEVKINTKLIDGYIAITEDKMADRSLATQINKLQVALKAATMRAVDEKYRKIGQDLGFDL